MRIALSLTVAVGCRGAIVDGNELVAGWFLVPDGELMNFKSKFEESKNWPLMFGTIKKADVNPASCHIEKEVKVDGLYKGHHVLMMNFKTSFKNAAIDKQYFLLKKLAEPRTNEQIEEDLKNQFFSKALKKLPLPIKKEWEQYIWAEVSNYFEEIQIIGVTPYEKAFVMKLPNVERLEELVEFSHKSFEFKEKFKRVPQLKGVVLGTNDIEHFNFKEWSEMLTTIGGQDVFRGFTFERQKAIVQAFELLGNSPLVLDKLELWHSTNLKKIGVLVRREQDKNRKAVIKNAFAKIIEIFSGEQEYLYAAINSFGKLFEEQEQNIRNNNIEPLKTFLDRMQYENIVVGAEELARVCSLAKVDEGEYKLFEKQYLENLELGMKSARSYPTIASSISERASWELLDMTVPRAWTVGIETHCCMHPTSVGGACLVYASRNPETSGILRIAFNGKTSAQSFMWLGEADKDGWRTLVLDNIEINGLASLDELTPGSSKAYIIDAYKNFAEIMQNYYRLFRIKAIVVGSGYSDINMSSITERKINENDSLYAPIPRTLNYTDARNQFLLKKFL